MFQTIRLIFFLLITFTMSLPYAEAFAATPTPLDNPEVRISSPKGGQALQGVVPIQGNCAINHFASAHLEFAYSDNPTNTWFLIQNLQAGVSNDVLAQWDTSTITDGLYQVRLSVQTTDGKVYQATIQGLRVRNYSPVETETPAPTSQGVTLGVTSTPNPTSSPPSPTPLPANPIEISPQNIQASLGKGALAVLIVFVLAAIFLGLRRLVS
jgi:hypothetical protein